jgi:hypothetical protein
MPRRERLWNWSKLRALVVPGHSGPKVEGVGDLDPSTPYSLFCCQPSAELFLGVISNVSS